MRRLPRPRRAAAALLAGAALALTLGLALPGAAGAEGTTTTAPAPGCDPHYDVLNGITVGCATVAAPGRPTRHLDADQFTAFMQTWLPASVVQKIPNVKRPTKLTIWTLASTTTYSGTTVPFRAFYATDGNAVYVGMPQQSLGWASVTKEKWIVSPSPADTTKAFAGKLKPGGPRNTPSTTGVTTTTVAGHAAGKSSGSSGSSSWPLYAIPVVLVVGVGVLFLARRRAARAG